MKKSVVLIAAMGVAALAFFPGCQKQEAPKPAAQQAPATMPSSTVTSTPPANLPAPSY